MTCPFEAVLVQSGHKNFYGLDYIYTGQVG